MACPNSREVIQRKLFQPTKIKGSRSGTVHGLLLLFPLGDLQYTQFWTVPINHPWEKKHVSRRPAFPCVSLLFLGQAGYWAGTFSPGKMCRLQMKTGVFSTGTRLKNQIACRVEN